MRFISEPRRRTSFAPRRLSEIAFDGSSSSLNFAAKLKNEPKATTKERQVTFSERADNGRAPLEAFKIAKPR